MLTYAHIEESLDKANRHYSKLIADVLSIDGMSGVCNRHFLNNICNFEQVNYLEIGTYKGSTVISASYKNKGKFTAIDNFCGFGGPKNDLYENKERFKEEANFDFLEYDCWLIDKEILPKNINVYFYDGPHNIWEQERAITDFLCCLSSIFIFIVDDWNNQGVRDGTINGIKNVNLNILYKNEIAINSDKDAGGWWCGMGVFLLEKNDVLMKTQKLLVYSKEEKYTPNKLNNNIISQAYQVDLRDGRRIWVPPVGRPFYIYFNRTVELTDYEIKEYLC